MIVAAAARQHARQERLHGAEHRPAVQVEGERPVGLAGIQQSALMNHAGAVEQNVDRTGVSRGAVDRGGIEHVQAQCPDLVRFQTAKLRRIHIGGDDLSSGGGECLSGRPPNALAGRRYEGCLTRQ